MQFETVNDIYETLEIDGVIGKNNTWKENTILKIFNDVNSHEKFLAEYPSGHEKHNIINWIALYHLQITKNYSLSEWYFLQIPDKYKRIYVNLSHLYDNLGNYKLSLKYSIYVYNYFLYDTNYTLNRVEFSYLLSLVEIFSTYDIFYDEMISKGEGIRKEILERVNDLSKLDSIKTMLLGNLHNAFYEENKKFNVLLNFLYTNYIDKNTPCNEGYITDFKLFVNEGEIKIYHIHSFVLQSEYFMKLIDDTQKNFTSCKELHISASSDTIKLLLCFLYNQDIFSNFSGDKKINKVENFIEITPIEIIEELENISSEFLISSLTNFCILFKKLKIGYVFNEK